MMLISWDFCFELSSTLSHRLEYLSALFIWTKNLKFLAVICQPAKLSDMFTDPCVLADWLLEIMD